MNCRHSRHNKIHLWAAPSAAMVAFAGELGMVGCIVVVAPVSVRELAEAPPASALVGLQHTLRLKLDYRNCKRG